MKLSIIIRTWNRLEYTIRTIVSISENCGLSKDNYEIICIDQNSQDGTKDWLAFNAKEGYYPLVPIFLNENVGDGIGMKVGAEVARGEFISQHDNDLETITPDYFIKLISLYKYLEKKNLKICAVSGSHKQGIDLEAKPHKFAKLRYSDNFFDGGIRELSGYFVSWVHGSFIFREKFSRLLEFNKGMCNSFCGEWWSEGYSNFNSLGINFYHIDSGITGAHIQKQYDKFPSYSYAFTHYKKFIKRLQEK